jgi:hypothetical protein
MQNISEKGRVRKDPLSQSLLLPVLQICLYIIDFIDINKQPGSLLIRHGLILSEVLFFDSLAWLLVTLGNLVFVINIFKHYYYIAGHFESFFTGFFDFSYVLLSPQI